MFSALHIYLNTVATCNFFASIFLLNKSFMFKSSVFWFSLVQLLFNQMSQNKLLILIQYRKKHWECGGAYLNSDLVVQNASDEKRQRHRYRYENEVHALVSLDRGLKSSSQSEWNISWKFVRMQTVIMKAPHKNAFTLHNRNSITM